MVKAPKNDEVKDEPGAEDRFMRAIRKGLTTPPTKHAEQARLRPKSKRGSKAKQGDWVNQEVT